jgi:soluble lytic murein transglycosylase
MILRAVLVACVLSGPPSVTAGGALFQGASDPVVDSARSEFRAGRTWHAAQLLAPLQRDGLLDEDEILLLARARAGYRDWPGVVDVLEPLPALGEMEEGAGWLLLGRAREALDRTAAAAEAYRSFLDRSGVVDPGQRSAVESRLSRMLWLEGDSMAALAALDRITKSAMVRSWTAAWLTDRAIDEGRTDVIDSLLLRVTTPQVSDRLWDARARVRLAAGDTASAARLYGALLDGEPNSGRAARGWRFIADAARLSGDRDGALSGYRSALEHSSIGDANGAWAARWLLELSPALDAESARTIGRRLDRAGDGARALRAYDIHAAEMQKAGREPAAADRVEHARLMSTVPARQQEAVREWRDLATHPDAEIGARTLTLWSALRRRQGRTSDYQTLRRWLVERYPGTSEAAAVVFFRADAAHDQQRWDDAVEIYGQVARMAPEVDYAGLSRMRAGQIHLHRGDLARAAADFEGYLDDFPSGRRWEEAAYWAAWTRLETGDSVAGLALLKRLREEEPFSYYTVLTADLLGEPYRVDLPAGSPGVVLPWLEESLATLDLLTASGLHDAAAAHADALSERASDSGTEALMILAEGFNLRDRTLTGINLGWAARREGEPWTDRLVRIVYPFPYQELVLREAREVGVDPLLLAALIRQESAFVPDIVSSAGAIGLMQVMPATGRDLARSLGVANFTSETLESPEINLHLGARFLVDQLDRYGPQLPLVLSAYNAGPARANRWKGFPQASDVLRLTERIPFTETRGYVKNVTRNRRLYEALYGSDLSALGR